MVRTPTYYCVTQIQWKPFFRSSSNRYIYIYIAYDTIHQNTHRYCDESFSRGADWPTSKQASEPFFVGKFVVSAACCCCRNYRNPRIFFYLFTFSISARLITYSSAFLCTWHKYRSELSVVTKTEGCSYPLPEVPQTNACNKLYFHSLGYNRPNGLKSESGVPPHLGAGWSRQAACCADGVSVCLPACITSTAVCVVFECSWRDVAALIGCRGVGWKIRKIATLGAKDLLRKAVFRSRCSDQNRPESKLMSVQ